MMAISSSLTKRATLPFSSLSESWPEVAENRKNGRMNKPGMRLLSKPGSTSVQDSAS